MVAVEPLRDGLAGATKDDMSSILEFAWQLKRRGLAESTIKQRVYRLKQLVKKKSKTRRSGKCDFNIGLE